MKVGRNESEWRMEGGAGGLSVAKVLGELRLFDTESA